MPPAKSTQERRHASLFPILFMAAALCAALLSCSVSPKLSANMTAAAAKNDMASQPQVSTAPAAAPTADALAFTAADTPASLVPSPTAAPTLAPTVAPTLKPTPEPSVKPTPKPTPKPKLISTAKPVSRQTAALTSRPIVETTAAQITALATESAPEPTPVPDSGGNKTLESKMISMVNAEREAQGLAALSSSSGLRAGALKHSNDMSKNNFFSHTSPTYGSFQTRFNNAGYSSGAENIAMYGSVEAAHKALMNSDGHRKNILNGSYTKIGIGIVYNGDRKVYYITQWFEN